MKFKIEVWIPPVRDSSKKIVRKGHWQQSPEEHSEEKAEELMRALARKGLVTRAIAGEVQLVGHPLWFAKLKKPS